ncbi:plasmid pRiA4b ORF-3 family protein [Phytohabitans sp. LJ34]|uniref:plasmid pRiA4b ORF-3 family protein n=1 Tax=Phytohabitans sp. LJ34 TaxID=3452217 RepID=UPI003F88AA87
MLSEMLDGVAAMTDTDDALEAELAGATVLTVVSESEDDLVPLLVDELIPQVEAKPGPGALALLLSVGALASGTHDQITKAAAAAADRLASTGIPKPAWAANLAAPLQLTDCTRMRGHANTMSVLVATFRRADQAHAFIVIVDHLDCGIAAEIFFVDADDLPEVLEELREDSQVVTTEALDPAEFRWYVEDALAARAVHEQEGPADTAPFEDEDEEDAAGPPFPVSATVVRSRLAVLPMPRKPADARPHHQDGRHAGLVADMAYLAAQSAGGRTPTKLPAKRQTSDGTAPIYQIKIGLRDTKPPIWRRLLVPADISLAKLHRTIQVAFGWDDSHLHVFETPYGDFGTADRELGHRAEKPVTLEQVAPQAKDKLRYTYDFGDNWSHEILVEEVLDPDPTQTYPRCVGGRRAAPPDDCGGVWGYEHLVEILTNPAHPDHQDRLEWMGWDDATHFDPAAFDPDEVNKALAKLR